MTWGREAYSKSPSSGERFTIRDRHFYRDATGELVFLAPPIGQDRGNPNLLAAAKVGAGPAAGPTEKADDAELQPQMPGLREKHPQRP